MAVSYGAICTTGATTGTTSVTASYPSGITALTSKLYLVVTGRSNTADTSSAVTGGGWTLVGAYEGGTGTWATDAGTRRVEIWKKDTVTGSETGSITVTLAGSAANTLYARIVRVEVTSGYGIAEQFVSGADTSSGTGFSATGGSALFTTDDLVLVGHAGCVDSATLSSQAISASGITFGTFSNRSTIACTGGNDHRHVVQTAPVTTGSGTPAAPTFSYTASASTSGAVGFVVLTEVAPPAFTVQPTDESATEGDDAEFSATVTGATSLQWQKLTPGTGALADVTGTPLAIVLTASATPTPPTFTVPADAIAVVVKWSLWPGSAVSMTSDFTGAFTLQQIAATGGSDATGIAYARVTSTGASKTITPVWTDVPGSGATFIVTFIKDTTPSGTWVRDFFNEALGSSGASTGTVDTEPDDLVLVEDGQEDGAVPAELGGAWTSLQTQTNNGQSVRVSKRRGAASPATTTSVTGNGAVYATLDMLSIISSGSPDVWDDVSEGSGGTTDTYAITTDLAMDGDQFRLRAIGPGGTVYSDTVTLTVNPDTGGPTGTLAVTESGPDTIAADGDVVVQGVVAASETGSDTAAIAGTVLVSGGLAVTEAGSDTAVITGNQVATGSLAVTESGSDTSAFAGVVVVQGALSVAEAGSDTAALAGKVIVQGALSASETGSDTASIPGLVLVSGSLAVSEAGSDAAALSGAVLVQGSISVTEAGADVFMATGSLSGGITGSLSATESGSDTLASSGSVVVSGALAAAEAGSDSAALAGAVVVQGSLSVSETGSDTFSASGSAPSPRTGFMDAVEQGSDGASMAGAIIVTGSFAAIEQGSDSALILGLSLEIDDAFIARPEPRNWTAAQEPRNWTATNTPRNWEART